MSGQPDGDGRVEAFCPSCRARVSHGQEWCTLCLVRLDAGPSATARDDGGAEGTTAGPDEPPDERPEDGPDAPPVLPVAGRLPPGVAEAMLAELAASTAAERAAAAGPLAGVGRGARTLVALGVALVLVALGAGLLTLLGQLL